MLIKLLPEQVSTYWNIIKYAVEESLPPTVHDHPDKLNRVLAAALSGKIDVWASYIRGETKVSFEGIVLTQVLYDDASDTRSLLIYCLYGYSSVSKDSWMNGFKTLVKYAKSQRCVKITAYSSVSFINDLAKSLGANTDYTFISFDLDKIV